MVPKRPPRRLGFEVLEARWTLSALPSNTIGVAQGTVSSPGAVADATVPIAPHYFALGRHTTVFTVSAAPTPGSALDPKILGTVGPNGQPLPFRHGAPFVPRHPFAMGYFVSGQPGPTTTAVTGKNDTTGSFTARTALPGDANGDGRVDLNDLKAFARSFLSSANDAFYKPSADANQNGFIGHGDALFIERNLTPLTPKIPLKVRMTLAPGEQVQHPSVHNSGGITTNPDITILGKTTPGSIVYSDAALGNYSFDGLAIATDAQGNFQQHVHLTDELTNFEYLVVDPYGQRTIRAFPVLLVKP